MFWKKGSVYSHGFWLKGSRFKGSEVDSPVTLTKEINGKEKSAKRLTLNREPGTF